MITTNDTSRLVIPGETIAHEDEGFMSGLGTYTDKHGNIVSLVAGIIHTIDKLITVIQKNKTFKPEIGDVVIGRIISVDKKSWRVDINSNRDSVLNLVNINLPEGQHRRRNEEDTLLMRSYFQENDLLSGEVLSVHQDGGVNIQTRNLKYGKLKNGLFVKINHNLVHKMKVHFLELINNVKCIIGMNGFVWVYYSTIKLENQYFSDDQNKINQFNKVEEITKETSLLIILFRNVIKLLDMNGIKIDYNNIMNFYNDYTIENKLNNDNFISYLEDNMGMFFDKNNTVNGMILDKIKEENYKKNVLNPEFTVNHNMGMVIDEVGDIDDIELEAEVK